MSVFGIILFRIFTAFSRIRTEFGELLRICPYSVRRLENAGKIRTRITPNTDAFYALLLKVIFGQETKAFRLPAQYLLDVY